MSGEGAGSTAGDRRGDSSLLLVVAGALLLAFSVGAAVQSAFVLNAGSGGAGGLIGSASDLGIRLVANLSTVALALVLAGALRLPERSTMARWGAVSLIALCTSLLRYLFQLLLQIYPGPRWEVFLPEVVSVFLIMVIAFLLGLSQADARARLRQEERAGARQALRAAAALEELSREELRVRREVAEELHGTVQNRLVLASARLGRLIEQRRCAGACGEELAELGALRDDLVDIRERDIRETSQLLYPAGVGLGLAHALRLLLQRIPASIATEMLVDPRLAGTDDLTVERRVLMVRAAEEAITNALKHGSAGRLSFELATEGFGSVRLAIGDDGTGVGSRGAAWSGLARLAERVGALGGELSLGGSPSGGALLSVVMPTLAG